MAGEEILVVGDEADMLEFVNHNLANEGYKVRCANSGDHAVAMALAAPPDLILLDLSLPGINGLEVCRVLKNQPKTATVPIVLLSAGGRDGDIVSGLEFGADDFLTKPFSSRVLAARIRVALRSRGGLADAKDEGIIKIHEVVVDPIRHEVRVKGKPILLTAAEFATLRLLALRPGQVYGRRQIMGAVRGDDHSATSRSVDVTIVGLRRKLGEAGRLIETIRGVGYRVTEELSGTEDDHWTAFPCNS